MKTLLLLGVLAAAGNLLATALPLSGRVTVAATGAPLEYATVSVYATDSTLLEGTITDDEGRYEFQLERGQYRIEAGFLGFVTSSVVVDLRRRTELPDLELTADEVILDAVEIRAERSQVNLLLDKKVYNVGSDLLTTGGSADRVLDQLPSVTVSPEGTISLRGNSGVRVLVNGRPSTLATRSLESIPAENIDRVEIITNPSAKYEAAGTAGIINIILKKAANRGYGGTAALSAGYPRDYRANLNLNLRRERWSAFSALGTRFARFRGWTDTERRQTEEGSPVLLEQLTVQDREDRGWNAYAGLDYNLTDRATLSLAYSIYDVVNDDESRTTFRYRDAQNRPLRAFDQPLDYLEPGTYHQLDFTYALDIGEGREVAVYLKNDSWREVETEATTLTDRYDYRTLTRESSTDWLLQADYEQPLGAAGRLELGVRAETRIISSDYLAEWERDGGFAPIPGFENVFDYFERIGSAYGQYNRQGEKVGLQVGLRTEYTRIATENSEEVSADLEKDYLRFFPSASLSFQIDEANNTQLSYSRRIQRPWFGGLNPFGGIGDATQLFGGNPNLDPTYTDRAELNFVHTGEKITFNPALYGSRSVDYLEFFQNWSPDNLFDLEGGTIREFPINLDREYRYGLEVSTNYRPSEALNINHQLNVYGYNQRGTFSGQDFGNEFTTWSTSGRLNLDVGESLTLSGNISYQAAVREAQIEVRPIVNGSFGFSKRWSDRINLTLNVQAARRRRFLVRLADFRQDRRQQWTGWRTMLTLRYRLEKGAGADGRRQRGSIR